MQRYRQALKGIAIALVCVGATAFLGYRYLQLSSEYRKRNFTHVNAVEAALHLTDLRAGFTASGHSRIAALIGTARDQAVWCTGNLTWFEIRMFERLGAGPALDICRVDVQNADRALEALDALRRSTSRRLTAAFTAEMLGDERRLNEWLDAMKADSLAFHPYIDIIEAKVGMAVRIGTLVSLLIVGVIGAALTRSTSAVWERRMADLALVKEANHRFNLAMNSIPDGFALFDADDRLTVCNEHFRRLTSLEPSLIVAGLTRREIFERGIESGLYADGAGGDGAARARTFVDRGTTGDIDATIAVAGDRHFKVALNHTPSGDRVMITTDVTAFVRAERRQADFAEELRRVNTRIRDQSLHDPLTGLPNRRLLDAALSAALSRGPTTLVRIDLDRFKQVNDVLGHKAGDFVLQQVARILNDEVRLGDLSARVGGDEFVVLCSPGTTIPQAEALARRLLDRVLEPLVFEGKVCRFGASFGVARSAGGDTAPGELLSFADAALYEAKSAGRRTVAVFTPALHQRIIEERRLGDEFAEALETGQIVPHFQTQHGAHDHAIVGVEVLARWRHPRRGLIAPPAFLNVARQLGMEGALDAHIFTVTQDVLHGLTADGLFIPKVSFNVSASRIIDPDFIAAARSVCLGKGPRIAFEILESVSMENADEIFWHHIDMLKDMGFDLEIDDFGSGHASIVSVTDLGPSTLKIDRQLVRPIEDSDQSRRMISAIVEIGRAMDIGLTAEGVETAGQAHLLADLGCDTLQGYHFSRPMDAETLREFVLRWQQGKLAS